MPLGPNSLKDLTKILAEKVGQEIDDELRGHTQYEDTINLNIKFGLHKTVKSGEVVKRIKDLYEAAGWSSVEISYSEGIFQIRLVR